MNKTYYAIPVLVYIPIEKMSEKVFGQIVENLKTYIPESVVLFAEDYCDGVVEIDAEGYLSGQISKDCKPN
jgi:hypothetical protein